jgi:dihydroorotase
MGYWSILIKNGILFDGYDFCGKKDVLISKGKIKNIADSIDETVHFVYDAKDKIVMPGMIDVHTHIFGISDDAIGTSADGGCFPFGVTTVGDGCSEFGFKYALDAIKTKVYAFVPVWVKNGAPDFKTAETLIQKFGDSVIGVKAYFDLKVSNETTIEMLKEICKFAKSKNLIVMVHCSNSVSSMLEIVKILSKGDILTHIYHGGNNTCLDDNYSAFALAREKGIVLDSGFAGHVHVDFDVFEKAMADGCFPNTISTDLTNLSTYYRGGVYGLTLCMGLCREYGMPEIDVLKAVTSNAAKALGKTELGSIEVGGIADIAVINYEDSPFDFTHLVSNGAKGAKQYKCYLTLSDGQIVWRR